MVMNLPATQTKMKTLRIGRESVMQDQEEKSTVFKMDSAYYKRTISKKKEYCLSKGRAVDKCLQITGR